MSQIKEAYIQRVATEQMPLFTPPPIRGYTLMPTADAVSKLNNLTDRVGGSLTSSAIVKAIPDIVTLDQPIEGCVAPIMGGWGQHRCSGVVEVVVVYTNGSRLMYRLTGYTDRDEHSYTGACDPETAFFINTIEEIRLQQGTWMPSTARAVNQAYYSNGMPGSHTLSTVRPSDMITDMSAVESVNAEKWLDDDIVYDSGVSTLTSIPTMVNQFVTTSGSWLATILNARVAALRERDSGTGISNLNMSTLSELTDPSITDNEFLNLLARRMNNYEVSGGWFRMADLYAVDRTLPNDDQRNVYSRNTNISTESADLWNIGVAPKIAQTIATHVGTYMYQSRLSTVNFTVTNMTISGIPSFQFNTPVGIMYSGADHTTATQSASTFQSLIIDNLLPAITSNNLLDINVTISASHVADIVIYLSVQHGAPERYTFPAFGTNTYSPILSARGSIDTGEVMENLITGMDTIRKASPADLRNVGLLQNNDDFTIYDI